MVSIDYITYVISVPKVDTQFVEINPNTGLEIRELNIDTFGKALADLQDDPEGVWAVTAYEYTPPASIGGIQLAPVLLILNPYTVTFEDGQYAVNLVGGNTNLQDFTNVNQVSIRPNNSAGNTFSSAVNSQSFINATVYINTEGGGEPGTAFPIGTPPRKVDNYVDAFTIGAKEGLEKYELHGSLLFSSGEDLSERVFTSESPIRGLLTFTNNNISECIFNKVGLTGGTTGIASFEECSISGLTGAQGIFYNCGFLDTVELDTDATEVILFRSCASIVAGTDKALFNCNGTTADINFRGWTGGAKITNFTGGGNMSIDVEEGSVEIDETCTAGVILVRGVVLLEDNSGIGCTVVKSGTVTELVSASGWETTEKEQMRDALGVDGDKTEASNGQLQVIKDQSEIAAIHAVEQLSN